MNQPVVIKGNKSGLIVHLDDKMEFPELKEKVEEKFASSSDCIILRRTQIIRRTEI